MPAGLVLAAGAGSRFGAEPKLLAELQGRPLLEHAIAAQCEVAELERVVVVLGAGAEEILARIELRCAEAVVCDRWQEGLSASLRCGIEALAGADKVVVTLGDEPLMTPALIARFARLAPGTRATYEGRPGHPVVLGPEQIRAVRRLRGDHGARELLADAATVECGALAASRDIDTAEDLAAVRSAARGALDR